MSNQITKVKIKNIIMEQQNDYIINKYFTIKNGEDGCGTIIECANIDDSDEEYQRWLFRAIELALPHIAIKSYVVGDDFHDVHWKSRNFSNYCGFPDYNNTDIHNINQQDIEMIVKWNEVIINHHKSMANKEKSMISTWHTAYCEYDSAMGSFFVEQAFTNLMTSLEALLIEGNAELSYRVALYAAMLCGDTIEEREEIFQKIKKAYGLRSSIVHGDIQEANNFLKKNNVYELMFDIREIASKALLLSVKKDKKDIISKINLSIFS